MNHSIISWDCSYRNFFHLIDALIDQDYDKDEYELIYIEQRTKAFADEYNHKLELKSLYDRSLEVDNKIKIKVKYLNHGISSPYHLGKCVNKGLELAHGDIISIMDGDMLLPKNFLKKLDKFHSNNNAVANIVRRMVPKPVDASFENWKEGKIDFDKCLEACPDANEPIPDNVSNKGPMISAHKKAWESVSGYDTHKIWSTGLSRLGQDVTSRLELFLDSKSYALPDCVAVHPYHPTGFSRTTFNSVKLLSLQQNIIDWSRKNGIYNWEERTDLIKELFDDNYNFINRMHNGTQESLRSGLSNFGSSQLLGKVYNKLRPFIRQLPIEWRV